MFLICVQQFNFSISLEEIILIFLKILMVKKYFCTLDGPTLQKSLRNIDPENINLDFFQNLISHNIILLFNSNGLNSNETIGNSIIT